MSCEVKWLHWLKGVVVLVNLVRKAIDCIVEIPYSLAVITLVSGGITLMWVLRLDHTLRVLPAWF